jgi:hypothetical protein
VKSRIEHRLTQYGGNLLWEKRIEKGSWKDDHYQRAKPLDSEAGQVWSDETPRLLTIRYSEFSLGSEILCCGKTIQYLNS